MTEKEHIVLSGRYQAPYTPVCPICFEPSRWPGEGEHRECRIEKYGTPWPGRGPWGKNNDYPKMETFGGYDPPDWKHQQLQVEASRRRRGQG